MRNATSGERRKEIDGLRAVAVLSVLAYHLYPKLFPGGFLGVDVFFAISGFLITGIILEKLRENAFSFKDFYARRIRRIFPALAIVLAAALAAGFFLIFADDYKELGKNAIAAAGFVSNLSYWKEAGWGYFDYVSIKKPLLHLWSLGIEEQFYLVLPALLFVFRKNRRLAWIIGALCLASFAANFIPDLKTPTEFYSPVMRFWELFAGSLLAFALARRDDLADSMRAKFGKFSAIARETLPIIGLALIFVPVFAANGESFHAPVALAPIAGTLIVIASGASSLLNRRILSLRPLVDIGLMSYPLYLWHWPIISFAYMQRSSDLKDIDKLWIALASFALAWLTYRFVEKPVRAMQGKKPIIALAGAMLALGACGFAIWAEKGLPLRMPLAEAMLSTQDGGMRSDERCRKEFWKFGFASFCRMAGDGPKNAFIINDSHAQALWNAYEDDLAKKGYTVIYLAMPGCSYPLQPGWLPDSQSQYTKSVKKNCDTALRNLPKIFAERKPDLVLVANYGWGDENYHFIPGMKSLFSLMPKSARIVWFLETPRFYRDPDACAGKPFGPIPYSPECLFPRSDFDWFMRGYDTAARAVLKDFPSVIAIDPTNALCDKKSCVIADGGKLFYYDRHHLSLAGAERLAERIPLSSFLDK